MKKICLAIVLSIVSVFSNSAQTTYQPNNNFVAVEGSKIKSETVKTGTEEVKTTGKTSETDLSAEAQKPQTTPVVQKPEVTESLKKPELPEAAKPRIVENTNNPGLPVLPSKNNTLGGLSTGNPSVDGYIEQYSNLYNVDPLLIYAQMNQESAFNARATSSKGASGFMQLMPDTARRFGVRNIYNTQQNIQAGVKYMRWLLDKFGGDMRLALAGYNAGEGAVMKYGNKIPPYRETQNYVNKIMNHYETISNQDSTLAVIVPSVVK
jgi:hypothetical protein